jgi:Alkaline phosphatase
MASQQSHRLGGERISTLDSLLHCSHFLHNCPIYKQHVRYKIFIIPGLFSYSHLDFEVDRDNSPDGDPSLANMTRKAIEILQKNPHGFFLFIEGKSLDLAILLLSLSPSFVQRRTSTLAKWS